MSKDKGREFVIYIYHDQIDSVGDKAVSENKTFEPVDAVSKALGVEWFWV